MKRFLTTPIVAAVLFILLGAGVSFGVIYIGGAGRTGEINLQKGLVGHWKLDSVSGTKDLTPYSNHGTGHGGITIGGAADRKGQANKATEFDGVDDYVDAGSIGAPTAYTAEAWVKIDKLSGGNSDQTTYGFTIMANSSAYALWLSVGKGGGTEVTLRAFSSSVTGQNTTGANLNTTDWFHIVAVATKNSTAKVYVNGVEKLSFTADDTAWAGDFTIGDLRPGRLIGFDGLIDEVRIYNRALSEDEITALYDQYDPGVRVADTQKGLVGHWKLDSVSGTKDLTPYSNHGTGHGGITIGGAADRKGQSNKATEFDGADDKISVPDSADWILGGGTGNFAITLWVNLATLNQGNWWTAAFIAQDEGGGLKNKWIFSWSESDDKLVFHVNTPAGGGPVIYSNVVSLSQEIWYQFVIVRDGNTWRFYKNGTAVGTPTQSVTIPDVDAPLTIGWGEGAGGFNGLIDDVRIYDRALSAEEITALYESYNPVLQVSDLQKGLVGHWQMDSINGVKDLTPYSNHGTGEGGITIGGAADRKGQSNKATEFDGTDDYVRVNPSSVFAFGTGNYTISQWVYVVQQSDVQNNAGLVSNYLAAACSWFTELRPSAGSYTYGFYGCGGHIDSGVTITYGQWAHFVVAREGTGTNQAKMYVNGVWVRNFTDAYNYTVTTNKLWLGNINFDAYPTTYRFNGFIDEVRIWNRALSEDEIQQLYESYQ